MIQPNAVEGGHLVKSLFVFERDSKFIHEFIFQSKSLVKHVVDSTSSFPHNFQSV
jgi:hypothetical protein